MKPLISIGIACYNVEKYLERCMTSVLNQTYSNTEIILVDDGSTDSTGKMCDEYARQYSNIKVIHSPNKGLSSARNISIENATGEYLIFVDPDDYVDTNMLEELYTFASSNNCDIVMFGRYHINSKGEKTINIPIKETGVIPKEEVLKKLFANVIESQAWQKFYKKCLWDNIRFQLGRVYAEDVAVMHEVFDKAKIFGNINKPLYYYYVNDSTLTTSYRPFKWMSLYLAFKERYDYAHSHYPQFENVVKAIALNMARLTNDNYIIRKEIVDQPYIEDLRRFLKSNIKFVLYTNDIKWYNKGLILFYRYCPYLYSKSIKYIHNIYYYFKPNRFR